MQNALAKRWAHLDVTTRSHSDVVVFSQDSGPTSGHQVITINGAHAEALVVGGVAYARADAAAVTSFLGFPASQVQRLAGHWISLVSTDAGYQTVSQGVTLASALGEETIASPEKVGAPTVLYGAGAVPISFTVAPTGGGPSGTGTLYISTGPATLPIELDVVGSDGSKTNARFSAWGAVAPLTAPSGAIPAATVPVDASS